jgi:hypothetical protein
MTDMLLIAAWCFSASLILPLFAWALMPLLPRCAATRHLIWLAMFAVLLLLPALASIVPPHVTLHQAMKAAPLAPIAAAAPPGWGWADALTLLIAAWLSGIGLNLARLALGLFSLNRLRRDSLPFEGMHDVRLADDGPLACGGIQPTILLPHDAAHWPRGRLEAVLAHERAHLRRRDCQTQFLAQAVCAFYWPNPLLWLAARGMRHQAEIAADNAVLSGGMRPSDYAAELLQLAGQKLRLPAVAMAAPSLEARVKSVLSPVASRHGLRATDAFKIAWLGAATALALAVVRPAIAQVRNDAPAPAMPHARAAQADAAPMTDAPPAPPAMPPHHRHRITATVDSDGLTNEDKARIDAAVAHARASIAGIRPEIDRAVLQARADREAAQAIQQAMPAIRASVAQAVAQIQPAIRQALADAKVDAQVSAALDKAQVDIDAAVAAAARQGLHPHIVVRVQVPPLLPMPPGPPGPGAGDSSP